MYHGRAASPYTTFSTRSLLYASSALLIAQSTSVAASDGAAQVWVVGGFSYGAGSPNNQKLYDYSSNGGSTWQVGDSVGGCVESLNTRDSYFAGVGTNPAGSDHRVLAEIHSGAFNLGAYTWGGSNFGSTGGTCASAQRTNGSYVATANAAAYVNDDQHFTLEKHKPTWTSDLTYCWYTGWSGVGGPVSPQDEIRCDAITSLTASGCPPLSVREGTGSLTVTAANSCELTHTTTAGGGIQQFYDLAEDPARSIDLVGAGSGDKLALSDLEFVEFGGSNLTYSTGRNSITGAPGRIHLLEATPTRVRVRSESLFQDVSGSSTTFYGLKATADHSIYPGGRIALQWRMRAERTHGRSSRRLKLVNRYESWQAPLNTWAAESQSASLIPPSGTPSSTDDFVLNRNENPGTPPGARTDFLQILYQDFASGGTVSSFPNDLTQSLITGWSDGGANTVVPAVPYSEDPGEVWTSVIYVKPTNLTDRLDANVTGRRLEYRTPDALSITTGSAWSDADENTASDNFNEAEATYLLQIDPTGGLTFALRRGLSHPVQAVLQDPALAVAGSPARHAERHPSRAGRSVQVGREAAGPCTPGESHRPPHHPRQQLRHDPAGVGHRDRWRWLQCRIHLRAVRQWRRFRRHGALGAGADLGHERPRWQRGGGRVLVPGQPRLWRTAVPCSGGPRGEPSAWSSGSTTTGPGRTCTSGRRTPTPRAPAGSRRSWSRPGSTTGAGTTGCTSGRSGRPSRNQMRILVNGAQVGSAGTYSALTSPSGTVDSYIGGCYPSLYTCPQPGGGGHADGVIDEFYIYAGAGSSAAGNPDSIGYAGLTGVRDSSELGARLPGRPVEQLDPQPDRHRRDLPPGQLPDVRLRLEVPRAEHLPGAGGPGDGRPAMAVLGRHGLVAHGRPPRQQRQLRFHGYDQRPHDERQPLVVRSQGLGWA